MASGDKSSKYKYSRVNVSYTLYTLARLAMDPVANVVQQNEQRMIVLLTDLMVASPYAYWVYDLHYVVIIVEHLITRVEENQDFHEHLLKLLELCATPPILCRTSEVLTRMKNIEDYFSFFGFILATAEDTIYKKLVLKALRSILVRHKPVLNRCVSLRVCHEAIERSCLPEVLGNLIDVYEGSLYAEMLEIVIEVAKISENVCITITKEGALGSILKKLDPEWNTYTDVLPLHDNLELRHLKTVENTMTLAALLLNPLRGVPIKERKEIEPMRLESLWGLRYTLRMLVVNGKKISRNFLLSLILQIVDLYPDVLLVQAGVVDDIAILAAASEMGTPGTWASIVHFGTDKEDFEFKKLLVVGVYYLSKLFGADYLMMKHEVILSLLKLITPESKSNWCTDHLCKLKYYALTVLERTMPIYHVRYLELNGMIRTLLLIDFYTVYPYDPTILIAALKCLNAFLAIKRDLALMVFCVQIKLTRILQNLIEDILYKENFNSANQDVFYYAFNILTCLTDTMEYAHFRSMDIIIAILKRILHPREMDIGYDPRMLVCMLTCFWQLGSNNDDFFKCFCDIRGIFPLLDVVKEAQFSVKIVALGLLVDLCEEGSCLPYLVSWRNKGTTFLQLLIQIFREENDLIGVQASNDGVVADYSYPLMGQLQRKQLEKLIEINSSPAITDMDCSCRPKIYALIQLLNVRYQHKANVANDYYKIYDYNLTLEDQLTKVLCENYLVLKMCETWLELSIVLKNTKFEVVSFDKAMLDTMLQNSNNWGVNIRKMQMELHERNTKNDFITEKEFYQLLRESKLGDALEALKELRYLARTTENLFYLTQKMKNNLVLQDDPTAQSTFSNKLGVDQLLKQKITLKSDTMGSDVDALPLVSPITESVNLSNLPSTEDSSVSFDFDNIYDTDAEER